METIEVSDEQYSIIQQLRDELSTTVVGEYGHVRESDAIRFVLDSLASIDDIEDAFATDNSEQITVLRVIQSAIDSSSSTDSNDEPSEDTESVSYSEESTSDSPTTGEDKLNQMMSLLDDYDDQWEESPSADYRYRVTLPDGTTTDVQTKDDVRAELFRHYL